MQQRPKDLGSMLGTYIKGGRREMTLQIFPPTYVCSLWCTHTYAHTCTNTCICTHTHAHYMFVNMTTDLTGELKVPGTVKLMVKDTSFQTSSFSLERQIFLFGFFCFLPPHIIGSIKCFPWSSSFTFRKISVKYQAHQVMNCDSSFFQAVLWQ